MVIKSVELETVCGITSVLPENELFEVAFAGKSNVGKSSMINTILNRKGMARISSQPGKTQTINFYNINNIGYLVDLPGYGYATACEEIKAQWGIMIENYLHNSKKLQAVFLLIDIRHEPSENDCMMYDWILHQGYRPIIIATKADKLKNSQINSHVSRIKQTLNMGPEDLLIVFSSMSKAGKDEILNVIDNYILRNEDQTPMTKEQLIEKGVLTARQVEDYKEEQRRKNGEANKPAKKARWKSVGKETKADRKKKEQSKAKKKAVVRKHKNKMKHR